MKTRDRYLSGILLVLIGIIIGTLIAFYQQQNMVNDNAEVKVTEIKHSAQPIFTDEELQKLDDRFLFKQVAKRVKPTVVYIETVVNFSRSDMPDDEYHNDRESWWGDMIPRRARTVGSGVIISGDGYILTNNHVIDGAADDQITVVLNDKRTFEARIVGQDPTTDLAVLKIGAGNLPAITIGNSNRVEVGEWVLAIGNPFRLRSTVTAGIVSALSRNVQITADDNIENQFRVHSFIQTDAAINKGNSGGALVNTSGELIGINTAIASQSGSYQGYGFAVPSNLAAKVAEDLIEYGEVRRALLGVSIVSIDARLAEQLNMNSIRGVYVSDVSPGGAAEKSGLQAEDVILSVDGEEVNESNELQQKIAVRKPGETVQLRIYRDGRELRKSVELGMFQPDAQQFASSRPGITQQQEGGNSQGDERPGPYFSEIEEATFDFGIRVIGIRESSPAENSDGDYRLLIVEVAADSKAEQQGLREGFQIISVENRAVEDLESLRDLIDQFLERNDAVTLEVETQEGDRKMITLQQ